MKFSSKITAVIMALVLLCTMSTPVFAKEKSPETRAEYVEMLADEGYPAITTAEFLEKLNAAGDFFRLMTNGKFPSEETLNITFDEFLTEANVYILSNSGLDCQALIKSFPPLNNVSSLLADTFEIDTVEFRTQAYALRDKFNEEGNGTMAMICHLLGCYMSIINKIEVFAEPTDNPVLYQVSLNVIYKDGFSEKIGTGIYINTETGECSDLNGKGMLGIGFNFSFSEMMIYAVVDGWMRNFGFAVTYDEIASLLPVYNMVTRRYYFDYDGLQWMIQVWKGNYVFITNGSEVGVYNRVPGEELGTYYNCATDDQLMTMTMKLSHGSTVLLDLGAEKHWWINGFKLNGKKYDPESLKLEFSIEMPDMEMVNAFTKSIDNEEHHDATYTVSGTTVSVVW